MKESSADTEGRQGGSYKFVEEVSKIELPPGVEVEVTNTEREIEEHKMFALVLEGFPEDTKARKKRKNDFIEATARNLKKLQAILDSGVSRAQVHIYLTDKNVDISEIKKRVIEFGDNNKGLLKIEEDGLNDKKYPYYYFGYLFKR